MERRTVVESVTHLVVHDGYVHIDEHGVLLAPNGGRIVCEQNQGRLDIRMAVHMKKQPIRGFYDTQWEQPASSGFQPGFATHCSVPRASGPTTVDFGPAHTSDFGFGKPSTPGVLSSVEFGFGVYKSPVFSLDDVGPEDTNTVAPATTYVLATSTAVQKITVVNGQLSVSRFLAKDLGILLNQGSAVTIPCGTYDKLLVQCLGGTLHVAEQGKVATARHLNVTVLGGGQVSGLAATESAVISVLESGAIQCAVNAKTTVCRLCTGGAQCNLYTLT